MRLIFFLMGQGTKSLAGLGSAQGFDLKASYFFLWEKKKVSKKETK